MTPFEHSLKASHMHGTGQYRSRGTNEQSHTAFVNDRSISFDIGEQLYRWRGYVPDFDQLPWVEIGEARPARQSVGKPDRLKKGGAPAVPADVAPLNATGGVQ
jgi:hypothetical protein